MDKETNAVARRLWEVFQQLRSLKWKQSPVPGLKSSEILVLYCIKKMVGPDSAGIKVSDISSKMRVAPPTSTQLINSLASGGYVERTMDNEDRRAVRVTLTKKGEHAVKKASDALINAFDGLVDFLGEEKSRELADSLSKVFTYFNEMKQENQ